MGNDAEGLHPIRRPIRNLPFPRMTIGIDGIIVVVIVATRIPTMIAAEVRDAIDRERMAVGGTGHLRGGMRSHLEGIDAIEVVGLVRDLALLCRNNFLGPILLQFDRSEIHNIAERERQHEGPENSSMEDKTFNSQFSIGMSTKTRKSYQYSG